MAEDDLRGGVDAEGGGDEDEARVGGAEADAGEVAVALELAEAAVPAGLGVGMLGVVEAHADPVVEALEGELGVFVGFDFEDGKAAVVVDREQVEHAAVAGSEGGDLGVGVVGEQRVVEAVELAPELAFEPALGLHAEEQIAAVAGGVAAGAELGDELAECGFGFGGERGLAGAGADGDLLEAVEVFSGAQADAGEVEAVEEKGELGGAAETLFDDWARVLGDEGTDLFGGGGETLAGAFGSGCVDEAGGEVAVVGGVAEGEGFFALVQLPELPGRGIAEPGHAREGEGGGAGGDDESEAEDGAAGGGCAVQLQPEDAEGEDAVDGGGQLFGVDRDDGPGLLTLDEEAAGVGGAEALLEVHGGAEACRLCLGELAQEGAFEDLDEAGAGGFAGGRGAAFAVAGELEQGGFGVAELEDLEAEGMGARFGGYDAANEVAGVAPEVEGAAAVGWVEGVAGVAEVEEGLAVFEDEGVGPLVEEGLNGVEDEFGGLRLDCSGGRHGNSIRQAEKRAKGRGKRRQARCTALGFAGGLPYQPLWARRWVMWATWWRACQA